jgi:phosphoribosylformimino-5-aminoimidazole carboxamide ribotide isomerase
MQVVPVIDIRAGLVVRATGGDRAAYRPIHTPLAVGSGPVAVVHGLQTIPFPAALRRRSRWHRRPDPIAPRSATDRDVPGLELWVDNGIAE